MRRGWHALLIALIAAPASAQTPPRTVTLEQATEMALQNNPVAVTAAEGVTIARAQVLQARGAWLPTLNVSTGFSNSSNERFDQITGERASELYTNQIALGYELFDGGRRIADQRSASAAVVAANATYREQRYAAVLRTTETFYAAAAASELLGVARQRLERAQQQLAFAQRRLQVGTATRSDILRAELEVGNAELAIVDAESAQRTAQLELGRLIGVDGAVQPASASLPASAPELPDIATLVARAEAGAPMAIAASSTLSRRQAEVRAARAQYWPSLRAAGGYDWSAIDFPADRRSWNFRLTASLPVLNGFGREANVARARATERIAEAQARDATIAARIAAEDAAQEISAAERRAAIADRAVALAQEDLRVQEQRYQIGAATILDLQTSQVALAEAEVARVRARQALGVNVARLEAVLGEPLAGVTP
ncbi:TolC family outer membrane protein [soil metagenome]